MGVLTFFHGNPGGNHTAYGATQYARSAAVKRKIKTIVYFRNKINEKGNGGKSTLNDP